MNEKQDDGGLDIRLGFHILYFLTSAHANCFVPFLRRGIGREGFGAAALGSLAILILMIPQAPEFEGFLYLWLVAVVCQRISTHRRLKRGERIHSRYNGWPWLAMKLPFVRSEKTCKVFVEPMLCMLIGTAICPLSESLGGFIICGMFTLNFQHAMDGEAQVKKVRRMRDAAIEQKLLSRMYRSNEDF